jgi:DNA-binding IclR family transcriptional regulator
MKAYTPNTITSLEKLHKELEQIRADGCAYDREEHTLGICAVGAVLNDPFGRRIAISVPVPATRFYGHEEKLTNVLLKYCRQVENALGRKSPRRGARSGN